MARFNNFRKRAPRSRKTARKSSYKAGIRAGIKIGKRIARTRRTSKKRWY